MLERPDWPNFGDGPAHLHGDERWKIEAGTAPSHPLETAFARFDEKTGTFPPGTVELRAHMTPEDLQCLALSAEQSERLIAAINRICGPNPDMAGVPNPSPGFAQLDDEVKELYVQFQEELAYIFIDEMHIHERRAEHLEWWRQERRKTGWRVDTRLN